MARAVITVIGGTLKTDAAVPAATEVTFSGYRLHAILQSAAFFEDNPGHLVLDVLSQDDKSQDDKSFLN
jgi:hypothetical protein